jgi:PadR family transcriptional regulator PadR
MSTTDAQMLKGLVTMLLLHLLKSHEDYGYSLVVRLQEAGLTDMAEGTVYPALARAEAAGHVESSLVQSERGPARKYYRLTESGSVHLTRSLDNWRQLTSVVTALTEGPQA